MDNFIFTGTDNNILESCGNRHIEFSTYNMEIMNMSILFFSYILIASLSVRNKETAES